MIVEATAPCSIELAGGTGEGAVRLAIAIDRRASCRLETGHEAVAVHAKDQLRRFEGRSLAALGPAADADRAVRVLRAAGMETGFRAETQARVPSDTGLAVGLAVSVAVAAAAEAAGANEHRPAAIGALAAGVEAALGDAPSSADVGAALLGGVHVSGADASAGPCRLLAVDPARIEECLLLVDVGPPANAVGPGFEGPKVRETVAALEAGRYGDVAGILGMGTPGSPDPRVARIRAVVGTLTAAVWACRTGRLVAVWAAPGTRSAGPREAVEGALRDAGLRPFPARVDVRGLEVE